MGRRVWFVGASATCATWLTACSLIVSLDGLSGGALASDAAPEVSASDASGASDARPTNDDAQSGVDGGSDACPGTAGPAMVRVGVGQGASYCIDKTEVTHAQYAQFLAAASMFNRAVLPPRCASHGPFVPLAEDGGPDLPYPAGHDDYPVGNVDWCDAYAFCLWAGKRLCGRIGGGPNPQSAAVDPSASQWFHACSLNGTQFYPYGDTYDPAACDSRDHGATIVPVAVGTLTTCTGGYPGIFDMAGNVEEIEDSCDDAGNCYSRGGSFVDNPPAGETRCDTLSQILPPGGHSGDIGFRCCGP